MRETNKNEKQREDLTNRNHTKTRKKKSRKEITI